MKRLHLKATKEQMNNLVTGQSLRLPVTSEVATYILKHKPRYIEIINGYPDNIVMVTRLFDSIELTSRPGATPGGFVVLKNVDCRDCIRWENRRGCDFYDFNACDGYKHFQLKGN